MTPELKDSLDRYRRWKAEPGFSFALLSELRPSEASGERHSQAKLSGEDVLEIRRRYAAGGITQEELAAEYGISGSHVCGLVNGRFWKVVSGDV